MRNENADYGLGETGDVEMGDPPAVGSFRGKLAIHVQKALSGLDDEDETGGINPDFMRKNPTRIPFMLFYGGLVTLTFVGCMKVDWWIVLLSLVGWFVFSYWVIMNIRSMESRMRRKGGGNDGRLEGFLPNLFGAYEKMIGIWFGCAVSFCIALVYAWCEDAEGVDIGDQGLSSLQVIAWGARHHFWVLVMMTVCFSGMVISWYLLAFVWTDPGVVYSTRAKDYAELLNEIIESKVS